jgi:hypothetical protein
MLFYWQPDCLTKGMLTFYKQRIEGLTRNLKRYYTTALNEVKIRLSNVEAFQDVSCIFTGDHRSYFIDLWYVAGAGNEVIARRMLEDAEH